MNGFEISLLDTDGFLDNKNRIIDILNKDMQYWHNYTDEYMPFVLAHAIALDCVRVPRSIGD